MSADAPSKIDLLARKVRARVPYPIDVLEVAAVIESMGITDTVATEDYGVSDGFELAGKVFESVRAWPGELAPVGHDPESERDERPNSLVDVSARGLLALAPLCVLLIGLQALALAGWDTGSILALSIGVTASMLLTSGPIVAIGRRTSVYLGFEQVDSARRFITGASLATLLACTVVGLGTFGVTSCIRGLYPRAAVDLRRGARGVRAPVAARLGPEPGRRIGARLRHARRRARARDRLGPRARDHRRGRDRLRSDHRGAPRRLVRLLPVSSRTTLLPRATGPLLLDSAPYLFFGSAFALFLIGPHLLGLDGRRRRHVIDRVTTLELSLLIALVPVVLATGVSERVLRSFWTSPARFDGERRGRIPPRCQELRPRRSRATRSRSARSPSPPPSHTRRSFSGALEHASQLVFLSGLVASCSWARPVRLPVPARAGPSGPRSQVAPHRALRAGGARNPHSRSSTSDSPPSDSHPAAAFAAAAIAACLTVLAEIPRRYSTAF